ncbi:ketoacyl-ACP synthase III [endosymbiont of Ridgeia piscesae]|jgi:3-oxoacyl-[acyl-carrier-protein] synthase-3|uniref:Hydroxymethylglutaryl-CoA synthase n=1 Tax=endosymbiont of Ridgeia piscesae TaxID=54398 RepID=A0A0T5YYV9_9GAMM|nr:ketoacyl-ACP synthase III [endosymbiont of Ridgeia piscesae]KRT55831.1 hydroxymethylglutaryl-CoA synthase [endosymbiont of Ridgeia piscesae]KRT57095.1 hydroxymethylglutaryl-CoA synthase [endosymbiont of Ridgeia piscesae]
MIGIETISIYLPGGRVDNTQRLEKFDITEEFLRTKTGMTRLSRKGAGEETSDMCCAAVRVLMEERELPAEEIECLIVCTQNPDGYGLPHTSAIVHGKLGLTRDCAVFDISLGCSGYVYGLSVIKGFMLSNGFTRGILVTADPYSKVIDEQDKNTSLLFGDAATATLISDRPKWDIGRFCFGTDGTHSSAINVKSENRRLEMNGRAVFNFTATVVPGNISRTLELNGLEKADIDRFVLHQGSRYIRDTLAKRMGLALEKVPFQAGDYGNTISSSVPLILANEEDASKHILISGFGVGLSWASTVLTKVNI